MENNSHISMDVNCWHDSKPPPAPNSTSSSVIQSRITNRLDDDLGFPEKLEHYT